MTKLCGYQKENFCRNDRRSKLALVCVVLRGQGRQWRASRRGMLQGALRARARAVMCADLRPALPVVLCACCAPRHVPRPHRPQCMFQTLFQTLRNSPVDTMFKVRTPRAPHCVLCWLQRVSPGVRAPPCSQCGLARDKACCSFPR